MKHRTFWLSLAVVALIVAIGSLAVPLRAPSAVTPGKTAAKQSHLKILASMADVGGDLPIVGEQPRRGRPTLTFLAKADGKDAPRVVSDATGWGERADGTFDFNVGKMTRIEGTDWFALETEAEPYARIEYLFVYGGSDYRLDPRNPRKAQRVGGPASEVVMPGYKPPQEFEDAPTVPAGHITETLLDSHAIGQPRRVIVYTPPGYKKDGHYPAAVFHDGDLVVNTGQAPRVIDWLIAHNAIQPIVAVFVDPQSRSDDFKKGAPMRSFVTGELLPWLAQNYSVTTNADERAIIGLSAGARGALDAASSSTVFGKLGLLIPALGEPNIDAIPQASAHKLRVSIIAGTYDALNLGAARSAQLVLADRGHTVDFKEVPEGHTTSTWRNHLRDVLIGLFGKDR